MITFKVLSSRISQGKRLLKGLLFGTNDIREKNVSAPFGDDSNAPEGMIAVYSPTNNNSGGVVIGYINIHQLADVGEKRIYSTNEAGDQVSFAIHLRNDGTAEIGGNSDNAVRYSQIELSVNELKDDLNNLKSILNGWVPAPTDGGAALKTALTAANYPTTPISEDITNAKIEEIKTL